MKRIILAVVALAAFAVAADAPKKEPAPGPNKSDEPRMKTASLNRAAEFLDAVSLKWTEQRKCGTCHTNVPHLMAMPALKRKASEQETAVRAFFEQRVKNWDRGEKGDQPRWDTEVVVTGVTLALHDAGTSGKLHPLTRKALDRMWTVQAKDGAWNWLKCKWPPLEHDDYYGAVFAALGVGVAPDDYAKSAKAKAGIEKLKAYLKKTPAPNLHHKGYLMWASLKLDGLMSKEERDRTVKELLAKQREDGGWSLASLGDWEGKDGRANDSDAASDGYATGLVVYLLRQAGVEKDHDAVKKGAAWLKSNQRVSGRWFTQSLNTDSYHFISHAGTAFAVLALKACE